MQPRPDIRPSSRPGAPVDRVASRPRRAWHEALAQTRRFAQASYPRALWQLASTLILYAGAIAMMFATVLPGSDHHAPYALTLLLSLVASVAYMRLFMIGHDAGHGSFLPEAWQNVVVGNLMGVLTNTPIGYWARQHHLHHQGNANLDKRGHGDVDMWTTEEFRSASASKRLGYRIYRNPFFLFLIAAPVHFVLLQRYPIGHQASTRSGWASVMGTNLAIAAYYGALIAAFGLVAFLKVFVPVLLLSSTGAVWLFYVQHQYAGTYYRRQGDWDYQRAALEGSSFYDLPRLLHWASANIGYHHIHHLNPKVPNYRLPDCHREVGLFQTAKRLSLRESLSAARLALWDEERQELIGFGEAGPAVEPDWAGPLDPVLAEPEASV